MSSINELTKKEKLQLYDNAYKHYNYHQSSVFREKHLTFCKNYNANNPEVRQAYRDAHREKIKIYNAEYHAKNKLKKTLKNMTENVSITA